jgi:hypothetical protein
VTGIHAVVLVVRLSCDPKLLMSLYNDMALQFNGYVCKPLHAAAAAMLARSYVASPPHICWRGAWPFAFCALTLDIHTHVPSTVVDAPLLVASALLPRVTGVAAWLRHV